MNPSSPCLGGTPLPTARGPAPKAAPAVLWSRRVSCLLLPLPVAGGCLPSLSKNPTMLPWVSWYSAEPRRDMGAALALSTCLFPPLPQHRNSEGKRKAALSNEAGEGGGRPGWQGGGDTASGTLQAACGERVAECRVLCGPLSTSPTAPTRGHRTPRFLAPRAKQEAVL